MELKYSITREEFLKAARFAPGFKALVFFYSSYVLLFTGICWYFYCAKTALISLPVWAVLFYFLMLKQSFNTTKQLIPDDETFEESVVPREEDIVFSIDGLSLIVPYKNISKISTIAGFIIITSKAGTFSVPRAVFGGTEREGEFISLLKQRGANV